MYGAYLILACILTVWLVWQWKVVRALNHPETVMRKVLHRLALARNFTYIEPDTDANAEVAEHHGSSEAGLLRLSAGSDTVYGTFLKDDVERSVDFVVTSQTAALTGAAVVVKGDRPLDLGPAGTELLSAVRVGSQTGEAIEVSTNTPQTAELLFTDSQSHDVQDFEGQYSRTVTVQVANDQLLLRVPVELNEKSLESVCADAMQLGLTLHRGLSSQTSPMH